VGQFEIQLNIHERKDWFPQRRKDAKVLSDSLSLLIFFAPLRLCGSQFFVAIFETDPLLPLEGIGQADRYLGKEVAIA
jgi:hypothetical protein